MTEINDDATAVTLARSREVAEGRSQSRPAPLEREDFGALSSALDADAAQPLHAPAGGLATGEVQVPSAPARNPGDEGAAFRQARLAITAGLVVLLLVVWILQRRSASRH